MKTRFTLLAICAILAAGALAQEKPTAVIFEASTPPVIDGLGDDEAWADAPLNYLDRECVGNEGATIGNSYWQGLWTYEGMYVLVTVDDDDFFPWHDDNPPGTNTWEYDKVELYFDVNYLLEDEGGPLPDWVGGGNGHYQVDASFAVGLNDGTPLYNNADARGSLEAVLYAFNVFDPDYVAEYFVPFSALTNNEGGPIDLTGEVGFDVYVVDRDEGNTTYGIQVWANTGGSDGSTSSWNNMDDCGIITFDGAEAPIYISAISLSGGEITENNGTTTLDYVVSPEDANEAVIWSVEDGADGGRATINHTTGEITAILNGTVTVTCKSASGFTDTQAEVTITGQIVSLRDVNVIRNPNFDRVDADDSPSEWGGGAYAEGNGGELPTVVDGVVVCAPNESPEEWHYQLDQMNLTALPDIDYIFSFVAWADDTRYITVNFEDAYSAANWNQYGYSNDPRSIGNRSSWRFDATTESTRYEFDVKFDQMNENTIQRLCFQLGMSGVTLYLDSFVLVSVDDYALVENYTEVTWIDVTGEGGATSVALGGTLQMSAAVSPAEADYPDVKWSVVPGTGWATIDENGLLSGDSSGNVTVIASAVDDSGIEGTLEVFVSWPEGISPTRVNELKVYPNPAINELTVELGMEHSLVSIFNSVGQKMDEVLVSGTEYRFDISGYPSGLYFVRTEHAVSKFIK
jgi:hypothetical protein